MLHNTNTLSAIWEFTIDPGNQDGVVNKIFCVCISLFQALRLLQTRRRYPFPNTQIRPRTIGFGGISLLSTGTLIDQYSDKRGYQNKTTERR